MNYIWPFVALGVGSLAASPLAISAAIKWNKWRFERTKLDEQAQIVFERERIRNRQLAMQHIAPDENGRGGWLTVIESDGVQHIVNLDTRSVFNQWAVQRIDPMVERLDRFERQLLLLARGSNGGNGDLLELPEALPQLPRQISIEDVLGTSTPTLDALTIGVALDETGNQVPVTRSLYELMHLLAIGITGSGKSTWLLSFLAQIEMCQEPIDVFLIDVHGSAFNLCADWSKLKYPIARTNAEAKTVLEAVRVESERRSALYEAIPLAEDLASYNAYADEPLDPWLIVIDEGTLMLADKAISDYVARGVQGTRQFGLYVFMTGQTGNTSVIDSPIRANFPTRICYTTEGPSMRAALGEKPPGELEEIPGRGWARLKGKRTPIKIQAPYIRRENFYRMIEHDGPQSEMPETLDDEAPPFTDQALLDAWAELPEQGRKQNKSELCKALGGQPAGAWFYKIDETARRLGIWE